MRHVIACLLVLALAGCSEDDAKSNPLTTTAPAIMTTVASTSDDNPGSESIRVTEKITITVTDPED